VAEARERCDRVIVIDDRSIATWQPSRRVRLVSFARFTPVHARESSVSCGLARSRARRNLHERQNRRQLRLIEIAHRDSHDACDKGVNMKSPVRDARLGLSRIDCSTCRARKSQPAATTALIIVSSRVKRGSMHHELISPRDQPGAKVNNENPPSIFFPLDLGQAGGRVGDAWSTEIARELKSGTGGGGGKGRRAESPTSLSPEFSANEKPLCCRCVGSPPFPSPATRLKLESDRWRRSRSLARKRLPSSRNTLAGNAASRILVIPANPSGRHIFAWERRGDWQSSRARARAGDTGNPVSKRGGGGCRSSLRAILSDVESARPRACATPRRPPRLLVPSAAAPARLGIVRVPRKGAQIALVAGHRRSTPFRNAYLSRGDAQRSRRCVMLVFISVLNRGMTSFLREHFIRDTEYAWLSRRETREVERIMDDDDRSAALFMSAFCKSARICQRVLRRFRGL